MGMKVCNLASGSKGNCTYIESESVKILIDAGLVYSEIASRLALLNVSPKDISAILVTHEHCDHVRALDMFSKMHKTPIYVHGDGWAGLKAKCRKISDAQRNIFYGADFVIGDLTVSPISLSHDASHCTGYSVSTSNKKFSILTDLGKTNNDILQSIKNCQLLFIEANHNVDMLKANPRYPLSLKRRILSGKGHLSNETCGEFLAKMNWEGLSHVVLSHLSEENNTPQIAVRDVYDVVSKTDGSFFSRVKLHVASQEKPTALFNLK